MKKKAKRLFSYFNDSHLRSTVPSCRTDKDFYKNQMLKFGEALTLAQSSPLILHGGDLFTQYDPPYSLMHDVVLELKKVKVPMYINPGNHDFFGAQVDTIRRSGIGILAVSGVLKLFNTPSEIPFDGLTLKVAPYRLEYMDGDYWFDNKPRPSDVHVVMMHDMLTTNIVPFPHKLLSQIKTNADIVLCSHWHSQFVTKIGNTWFVNSGPLDIQSVSEAGLRPAVVQVGRATDGSLVVELDYLKHTGYEVAETTLEESAKDLIDSMAVDAFVKELKGHDSSRGNDIPHAIETLAKSAGLGADIVQMALNRVDEAKKTLNSGV